MYQRGFEVVAQWPEELRCRVFAQARVPTKGWRMGRIGNSRSSRNGNGIDSAHLLNDRVCI